MIIDCFEILEDFTHSGGIATKLKVGKAIPYKKYHITKYDEFRGMYGRIIEEPYVELQHGNIHIGFGLKKTRILLKIKDDIEKFIEKHKSKMYEDLFNL